MAGTNTNLFSIRVHHGGKLEVTHERAYVGSLVAVYHYCNLERWSLCSLDKIAEELGYEEHSIRYYYLLPGQRMQDGLFYMFSEEDATELARSGEWKKMVDVFCTRIQHFNTF